MMLPTLLVVPGIYLKSDIAHRTSISVPPDFRLKVVDFYQNNGQFCGICLISSPHSPFQRCISFAVSSMIPFLALMQEIEVKSEAGQTQTASQADKPTDGWREQHKRNDSKRT